MKLPEGSSAPEHKNWNASQNRWTARLQTDGRCALPGLENPNLQKKSQRATHKIPELCVNISNCAGNKSNRNSNLDFVKQQKKNKRTHTGHEPRFTMIQHGSQKAPL